MLVPTWNRLADDIGIDSSPEATGWKAALVNYGGLPDFTDDLGGGLGDGVPVGLYLPWNGFATWPRYNAADATTTINVTYTSSGGYPSNTTPAVEIPWNPAWDWALEGDAGILIDLDGDGIEGEGYEIWRVYTAGEGIGGGGGGDFTGPHDIIRPWIFSGLDSAQSEYIDRGWRPNTDWMLCGGISYRAAGFSNVGLYQGHGGAETPKMAGILLGQELADAAAEDRAVPHALSGVGINFDNGSYALTNDIFRAPGNRLEDQQNPPIPESPDARLFPEGTRFRLTLDDAAIESWLTGRGFTDPLKSSLRAFARTMRDYGWIYFETGGFQPSFEIDSMGPTYPSGATWDALGFTSSGIAGSALDGLVTSVDDVDVVLAEAPMVEVPDVPPTPASRQQAIFV